MADDLDDDWWNAEDMPVAENGDSDEDDADAGSPTRSDNEEEAPDSEEEETVAEKLIAGKRKHEEDEGTEEGEKPAKKKKKKKRKTLTEKLAAQEPKALEPKDLIASIEKHYADKLTAVQWDEVKLEDSYFAYCNDLSHTCNSFLNHLIPKWQKKMKQMAQTPGSPILLLICSSALRAAQLNRDIAEFKRDTCKTAKLFAKHIKLKEQEKFLKKSVIHIGLGTPNRIQALLDTGSLHLDQVSHVVLDWSWRDTKLRRLTDVPEIRKDLYEMFSKHIIPHLRKGNAKIALM